ncbi:serine/threonine protein kinase [Dyadobacter fermentans]|uniref:serine/threonine protein kinase n=1 Tax=Dyadobacter fermentans TaxID=94254 RepID=UPI001CBBC4E8|nr:protein kinase [Dyadobacter fermentans]MBZ1358478.1 protein kinase [Dyadobacter fermentans]
MNELYDDGVPKAIKDFVRQHPDIDVVKYHQRGFNGEVYFGKRKKLDDEVVLKFYWADKNYDETEEAVILKRIKHKNVLEIYDLRFLPPYYAHFLTPKISGGDLQEIIDNRKLSSKEALEIVAGVLLGLTELHSAHSLVHRDLKPGNILIDLSDNRPIIADLGAVKKIDGAHGFVSASKATHLYLPPEAVLNNEYYFQSDIYQVGVTMFQLLGGHFPLHDPYKWLNKRELSKISIIRDEKQKVDEFNGMIESKIAKGTLIDTKTMPYYLDEAFGRVIKKATHIDHKKRYANPALFLKDVHKLIQNCPDYIDENDGLVVSHENGKCFRIIKKPIGEISFEKRMPGKDWRRSNAHNGLLSEALAIARAK